MNRLPISIIIPSLNEGTALRETVMSICAASHLPEEIIVVDDGSTDGSCDDLEPQTRSSSTTLAILSQTRQGVAGARNAGAAIATQPYLVFLDAHCLVQPDWLAHLYECLILFPACACCPAFNDPREPSHFGCGARIADYMLRYRWESVRGTTPSEIGIIPGGCMAIDRALFDRLGRFEAMKEFGYEDVEFCLRAWRCGITLYGVPAARIEHRFRNAFPYGVRSGSYVANGIRTALLHMHGDLLETVLTALSTQPGFTKELITLLGSDVLRRHDTFETIAQRSTNDYFTSFGLFTSL